MVLVLWAVCLQNIGRVMYASFFINLPCAQRKGLSEGLLLNIIFTTLGLVQSLNFEILFLRKALWLAKKNCVKRVWTKTGIVADGLRVPIHHIWLQICQYLWNTNLCVADHVMNTNENRIHPVLTFIIFVLNPS